MPVTELAVALRVLLNVVLFSVTMFLTSLVIERFYAGKYRWVVITLLALSMAGLSLELEVVPRVLKALSANVTLEAVALIISGGLLSGMFISSVCIFFRLIQMILRRVIS